MEKMETMEQKRVEATELAELLSKLPEAERQKFFWMVKGAAVVAEQERPKSA